MFVDLNNKVLDKPIGMELGIHNSRSFISAKIHYFPSLINFGGSHWDWIP